MAYVVIYRCSLSLLTEVIVEGGKYPWYLPAAVKRGDFHVI
jgi:hypothetical protein